MKAIVNKLTLSLNRLKSNSMFALRYRRANNSETTRTPQQTPGRLRYLSPNGCKKSIHAGLVVVLLAFLSATAAFAGDTPTVVYWDSAEGKALRARIPADADYWQLIPNFAVQQTQSYCAVASAITVLNAMPVKKPVDPTYAPYAYFTQSNFFTPEVSKIINAQTVLAQGMTREEMAETLTRHSVKTKSIAGDTFTDDSLRALLQKALGDDGQFVLANYFRGNLGQVGGGHWSALAAYDAQTDSVLILDVAKYKYPPAWVAISTLRQAIATIDTTSNKARGLVVVSK